MNRVYILTGYVSRPELHDGFLLFGVSGWVSHSVGFGKEEAYRGFVWGKKLGDSCSISELWNQSSVALRRRNFLFGRSIS